MNQTNYEQIIVAGIRRLPPEKVRQVADFVLFLRQREENGEEEYQRLIEADLAELGESELKHLEEEFEDYYEFYVRSKF